MTSRSPAIAPHVLKLFAARDAAPVEVAVLQPAEPFLDMAGEDLRRRIFLTESETGQTLCLRPEFTIPVCLDHIASQAGTPRRYSYLGEVFRQRREGGNEFFQAGIEDLGDTDIAAADARLVADAHALLTLALPGRALEITLGDQSIFEAVLAALGLPRGWRMRLARAFGNDDLLVAALADLKNPAQGETLDADVAALVAEGDLDRLTARISAGLEEGGLPHSVGRTPEDIARRLMEKAELRKVQLPREALKALKKFLAITVPLAGATAALEAFAAEAGLTISDALAAFAARVEAMKGHGLPVESIAYDAAFGRPLDYYTGLVFEISAGDGQRPLAGGGRYDRLLTLLGAKTPIPGVGFSVWLDRIEQLRGDEPLPELTATPVEATTITQDEPVAAMGAAPVAAALAVAAMDVAGADEVVVETPEVVAVEASVAELVAVTQVYDLGAPDVAVPDVASPQVASAAVDAVAVPDIVAIETDDLVEMLRSDAVGDEPAPAAGDTGDVLAALNEFAQGSGPTPEPAAPVVVLLDAKAAEPGMSQADVAILMDELEAAILFVPDAEPERAVAPPVVDAETLAPEAVDQLVDDLEAAIELSAEDLVPSVGDRKPGEDR